MENPIVIKKIYDDVHIIDQEIIECVENSHICYWITTVPISGKKFNANSLKFFYFDLKHDDQPDFLSANVCGRVVECNQFMVMS